MKLQDNQNSDDLRYVTKDESRDFHKRRRAFVIYRNELFFIDKGSAMSHWEFCSSKLNLSKGVFNELTRGYYLDGNLVFYKNNFSYDKNVIAEALKYLNEIKKILKITEVKIYFGLVMGKPGENWPFESYYGDSLANNDILKKF